MSYAAGGIILLNNFGDYGESLWPVSEGIAAILFNKPYNLSKHGISKTPIYAENENEFFLKDFNTIFTFIKNTDGRVPKMISHENGKNVILKKIE